MTYAASLQASTTPAKVFYVKGYNSGAAQFIQLADAIALPANATVPLLNIAVGAASNFTIDFGSVGLDFQNGVSICNSSTAPTKTIGSANCQFFVGLTPL